MCPEQLLVELAQLDVGKLLATNEIGSLSSDLSRFANGLNGNGRCVQNPEREEVGVSFIEN